MRKEPETGICGNRAYSGGTSESRVGGGVQGIDGQWRGIVRCAGYDPGY